MSDTPLQDHFADLVRSVTGQLTADEVLLANLAAETTDFVRFNRARVRQPMTIAQAELELTLIRARRRHTVCISLTRHGDEDRRRATDALQRLRAALPQLPEDPYLRFSDDTGHSSRVDRGRLPSAEQAIDDVLRAAEGSDFVGLLSSGPMQRGFASSLGAFHWHAVDAFLLDWSLYHAQDKAVKCGWSGRDWDTAALAREMAQAREQLIHLAKPARTLSPGEYRAYLAPAAVEDLVGMLNWDGLSARAQRSRHSCVQRLVDGEATLSPMLTVSEDTAGGLAPAFDEAGYTRPPRVALIEAGRHVGSMVSPRTAAEYGVPSNGAAASERMASLSMAGGALPAQGALQALDTGLAIGNLHYLNFSDRSNGRITGMTRFATFWVEGGRIVAPVNVMRWDDTLYRLLGTELEALTTEPQLRMDNSTYEQRSMGSSRVPGALVSRMAFTL